MADSSSPRRHPRWKKWTILGVTLLIACALDLISKYYAERDLVIGASRRVLPFLSLERTGNTGVAFGLLGGRLPIIIVANLIALAVVFGYVLIERRPWLAGIAGGVIMGGSIGNLAQRIAQHRVTDFLKFPVWPNFNVADVFILAGISAIFIGVVVEAVNPHGAFRSSKPPPKKQPPEPGTTDLGAHTASGAGGWGDGGGADHSDRTGGTGDRVGVGRPAERDPAPH
jgi:signal peptidase II